MNEHLNRRMGFSGTRLSSAAAMRRSLLRAGKRSIATLARRSGLSERLIACRRGHYVLAYHRILPPDEALKLAVQNVMWTSPETFRCHIAWMKKIGNICSTDRLTSNLVDAREPCFYITFDDGWVDNYRYALPILKEYGVSATLFIATDGVDSGVTFWADYFWQRTHRAYRDSPDSVMSALRAHFPGTGTRNFSLAIENALENLKAMQPGQREEILQGFYGLINGLGELEERELLNWGEVGELVNSQFSIGSHTRSHLILRNSSEDMIEQELVESKAILEKQTGLPVTEFCYPNARYDVRSAELVARAGYERAYCIKNRAVRPGDDQFLTRRFLVYEELCADMEFFKLRLLETPGFAT